MSDGQQLMVGRQTTTTPTKSHVVRQTAAGNTTTANNLLSHGRTHQNNIGSSTTTTTHDHIFNSVRSNKERGTKAASMPSNDSTAFATAMNESKMDEMKKMVAGEGIKRVGIAAHTTEESIEGLEKQLMVSFEK